MIDPFRTEVQTLPDQLEWVPVVEGPCLPERARLWIAGMGGSAMAGEFLALRLAGDRPVAVQRDDHLPAEAEEGDAVLCVSHSGQTGEVLAVWEEASARGLPVGAVTSGGALWEAAESRGAPRCQVPGKFSPRSSLGYLLRAGWALTGGSDAPEWSRLAGRLRELRAEWVPEGDSETPATRLVTELEGRLAALACTGPETTAAARRWMSNLAENAQVAAAVWEFPEAAHNQIMAVARDAPLRGEVLVVALGTPRDTERSHRWDLLLDLLRQHGARVVPVTVEGEEPWEEALALSHLSDWVSVLLAERLSVSAGSLSLMQDWKKVLGKEGKRS